MNLQTNVLSLRPLGAELDTEALCTLLLEQPVPFQLVDVLPAPLFRMGHLPCALNLPAGRLRLLAPRYLANRSATVILYGSSARCTALREARETLVELGYSRVLSYPGGKRAWVASALPLLR